MNVVSHIPQDEYDAFVYRINDRFNAIIGPIFLTDAEGLYEAYLAAFPEGTERQYHTCSCCRHFIEQYGALAYVDDDGQLVPAVCAVDDAPAEYQEAMETMARLVRRAKIVRPFLSSQTMYGTPMSGCRADGDSWHHFAIQPTAARVYRATGLKTAYQASCEKREEMGSIVTALGEYSAATCQTALRLLKEDHLGNSAAALGQAQFLVDLHALRAVIGGKNLRHNLVWRAVAAAPSGFCHPRSSMIATLLDDIQAGMSFEQARNRWNAKMHPLSYQRPQAAPAAGAIAQAEKLFEAMGLAPALERRIALLEEIPKLWESKRANPQPVGGIFGHLKAKGAAQDYSMATPTVTITLEKFVRTVVGMAEKIEVYLVEQRSESFITITAPVVADAPKLFQWDHPFAWSMWAYGAPPTQYGLKGGWHNVAAITRLPARWGDEADEKFVHHGDGLILLVEGARETRAGSAGLFPQLLRSDLREVRSVIESYSNNAKMQGLAEGSAIGIDLRQGQSLNVTVRVTSVGRTQTYKIDRWD